MAMKKNVAKILIFMTIFCFLFYICTVTLKFKDDIGIRQMQDFYRLPQNSVDVLNVGSSHVGVNVDPEILLEQYGIKSYNLWAAVQPSWNTYYYLKEALKTQNPKLVCVETCIMAQSEEYSDYSRAIYNTLGMRFSRDKVEAIRVSVSEDMRKDFLLEWPVFHNRYADLKKEDFERYFWNYDMADGKVDSGYASFVNEEPILLPSAQTLTLYEKQEEYLRKIIALCKEREIPLLLFTTPYNASEEEQKKFNRIAEIAKEYGDGVVYKNFISEYDCIPIDFASDFADGGGHLNNYGIEKFSMYFGKYIKSNYDLPFRDEEYTGKFNLAKEYTMAYRMPESFSGNGSSSYLDTKQALYDNADRNWTLFADFETQIYSEDQIYLSCYAEQEDDYRGFLLKRTEDVLQIIIGDNYYVECPIPEDAYIRMAITKEGSCYTVYANGEKIAEQVDSMCAPYEGTLYVGCERDAEGNPYRFSACTVNELELYNEVVPEKDVMHWLMLPREQAAQMYESRQESVAYYLEEPFYGNGTDVYFDTEIHLYDDPNRTWTLLTEIDLTCDKKANDLVYLSCFNEEADNYHGLIIRYKDDKIEAILGNTYYLDIPDNGKDTMKIVLVKNRGVYTVYVDGEEFASDIESYCSAYMGSLLLGAQEESGLPIRISPVTVRQLEIYDELVPVEEIAGW